jgi:hypothetical protein
MQDIVTYPTSLAQWQALINEATVDAHIRLNEDLESYLVFLLMRFSTKPEIAKSVLAIDFLSAFSDNAPDRSGQLQLVGDKCLLLAGLFPGRAERKHVRISYFIHLGQSAYSSLSSVSTPSWAPLFNALSDAFVPLTDILLTARSLNQVPALTPLQAEELYSDTHSSVAKRTLPEGGVLGIVASKNKKL